MLYKIIQPDIDLSVWISSIEYLEWESGDAETLPLWIIPHGGAVIQILLDGSASIIDYSGASHLLGEFSLIGPSTYAHQILPKKQFRCLSVELKPEGLSFLSRRSISDYKNGFFSLEGILNQKITSVSSHNLPSENNSLLEHIRNMTSPFNQKTKDFYIQQSENTGIRQQQRRWRSTIGLSVREYDKCIRFSSACRKLQQIKTAREIKWADFSASAGYYDQSHFIRVCRSITGLPPVALHNSIRSFPLDPQKS